MYSWMTPTRADSLRLMLMRMPPLSLSLQRSRNPHRGRAQDEPLVCLQGRDITHQISTHRLSIRKTAEEVAIQTKQSQQVQQVRQVRQTLPAILPHLSRLKMAN